MGNTYPIYSKQGSIGHSVLLQTAANDYTGVSIYNREVFAADVTSGSFVQRLRFKARGANVATVARIYINNGNANNNWATAPAAPTGTPSASGGTMLTGNYYGMIIAIGEQGSQSVVGAYSTVVAVTGPTGSIAWSWTAVPGAVSYRVYITDTTGYAWRYFTSATNSFTQTQMHINGTYDDPLSQNQFLYGELSLPAIAAASATVAMSDIDYQMNVALPPGFEIYVGLGTTVAAGWQVSAIAGDY